MRLFQKLELALKRCGFSPLKSVTSYRKIGTGAWHDAYLVYLHDGKKLVIRLRKKVIYGRRETFDEGYLREDYEPVGVYYRQANRCQPGVCPTVYEYILDPELTFTIESYMGQTISLAKLTTRQAFGYGQQVGRFFRAMHAWPPPVRGFGELIWNGQTLEGHDRRNLSEIWQAEVDSFYEQLDHLSKSDWRFDRVAAKRKLAQVLVDRSINSEPVSLVNGDITPENLIGQRRKFISLVDPVPALHNGLRYASFFVYCYKSYLPNLSDAPRYARHQFQHHGPVLTAIADGYIDGYAQGEVTVKQNLHLEYFLWALDVAFENLQRLTTETNEEVQLRAGDKQAIAARLQRCLQELDAYQLE
jgi:hypothetical protein